VGNQSMGFMLQQDLL